jgi:hypothetical protein
MVGGVGRLGAIVALATAATTLILALNPNLVPTRERTVTIEKVGVEPRVTLNDYLSHRSVALLLDQAPDFKPERSDVQGVVISFRYALHGFKSKENLPFRWTLFDANTKLRLAESEDIDPIRPFFIYAEKSQTDIGTWEFWVNTTGKTAQKYFVRLELYDPPNHNRMTYEDSPIFSVSVPQ